MNTHAASQLPAAASDGLRDIVGPVRIVSLADELLLWGTLAVLLALIAALIRWGYRRKRASAQPASEPPLPPHTRARLRLDASLRLISEPDRFCTELSLILREYLEERFGWNVPDRTTEEFLVELGHQEGLSATLQELLQDFLTRCDFVKFARYEPAEPELLELHATALRVVEDTVPPPLPPHLRGDEVAASVPSAT